MSKKPSVAPATPSHPPLGTLIDGNTLELVEVLGVGGYGVVYRAVEKYSNSPRSYAVKCLISAQGQSSSRRHFHLREITLHQIASAHPSVVTLHRVVEDPKYTYIIMDYAPDDDLFTQILHKCRYLGDNALIKHVFLQLLDGIQYCHSLGIYHRDLKPENILCFDRGYKIAITDFGLATTEKLSREFRTGSVYHMSPECQAGDAEHPYSPMHNDIWSLGIILLNLVTGRNPWKSAMADDPTYQAYQRDPLHFLPSVLPISEDLNNLLVQTLDVDWQGRLSLSELRAGIQNIRNFYSDNVIFEGSLARCPWEVGLDLGNGANTQQQEQQQPVDKRPVPNLPEGVEPYCVFSMSNAVSEYKSFASVSDGFLGRAPWEEDRARYDQRQEEDDMYEDTIHTPYESNSARSSYTSESSSPATPCSFAFDESELCDNFDSNRDYERPRYYEEDSTVYPSSFDGTSVADTEDNRFASSVFLATPVAEAKPYFYRPDVAYMDGYRTQKRYSSPNTSVYSVAEESLYDVRSPTTTDDFPPNSPNFVPWTEAQAMPTSRPIDIQAGGRRSSPREANKPKSHNIFNPLRFFPRSSGTSWLNPKSSATTGYPPAPSNNVRVCPASPPSVPWNDYYYPHHPAANSGNQGHYASGRGHTTKLRSGHDW